MANSPPSRAFDPEHVSERGNRDLIGVIRAEIDAAGGRIPFTRFMELALYHPVWGYYLSAQRRPGRPGDFLTAPETHPFFGITVARQIAECWERLERPVPFVVREYGSGIGALAWDVIAGLSAEAPECRAALQYRLVEPNPHRRAQSLAGFAEGGLGDVVRGEEITPGADPEPITGVVIANEVADAFAVHRLIWREGRLREAIELAGRVRPNLVLMDIRLANNSDGVAAAIEIRQRFDIPSLFVSAHDDPIMRSRAEAAHPLGFIEKPFSPESLALAIEAALNPDVS